MLLAFGCIPVRVLTMQPSKGAVIVINKSINVPMRVIGLHLYRIIEWGSVAQSKRLCSPEACWASNPSLWRQSLIKWSPPFHFRIAPTLQQSTEYIDCIGALEIIISWDSGPLFLLPLVEIAHQYSSLVLTPASHEDFNDMVLNSFLSIYLSLRPTLCASNFCIHALIMPLSAHAPFLYMLVIFF